MTTVYPEYEYAANPRSVGDKSALVLVTITNSGDLTSASLFSSYKYPCEITQSKGYFFTSFVAKNEEEMFSTLAEIEDAIIDFMDNPKGTNVRVKKSKRTVAPPVQDTPPA